MVSYYTVLLSIIFFFQIENTDKYKNGMTLGLMLLSNLLMIDMIKTHNTYDSMVVCTSLMLLIATVTFKLHKSWVIIIVYSCSLTLNIFAINTGSIHIKWFIYDHYKLFNIILFECLLYNCLRTTNFYLFIKEYLNNMNPYRGSKQWLQKY